MNHNRKDTSTTLSVGPRRVAPSVFLHLQPPTPLTLRAKGFYTIPEGVADGGAGYNPRLQTPAIQPVVRSIVPALLMLALLSACAPKGGNTAPDQPTNPLAPPDATPATHTSTRAIDAFGPRLYALKTVRDRPTDGQRLDLYMQRWPSVERAVAHQGTTHRDTFYGSRAYWHTGAARGLGWAIDIPGDLTDPVYVNPRGNVRIAGDARADIEIPGDAVVHIFGDLDATLDLKGVCEVVIAGNLTEKATLICDGQLDLFVAGDCRGVLGATGNATIIIDGDCTGIVQCGAPATTLTVTGDLRGQVPAPKGKDAVLTLRVDGFAPTRSMLDLATAGFTRVNATLGSSDAAPGLYPAEPHAGARPIARWVVLTQRAEPQ